MTSTEELLTRHEAAKYLGISPGTLRNWTGRIPYRKTGLNSMYKKSDLDEYIKLREFGPKVVNTKG